jgi:hypothetical protein
MGWLLDTNILSELRRPKPDPKVTAFVAALSMDLMYVSAVTLSEIRFGIELIADANKRADLNGWLNHKVRPMFDQRVLPISEDVMFKWRLLVEDGRKAGHTYNPTSLSPRLVCITASRSFRGTSLTMRELECRY